MIKELLSLIPDDMVTSLTGNQTVSIKEVIIGREELRHGTIRIIPIPVNENGAQLIVRPRRKVASGMLIVLRVPHDMKIHLLKFLTTSVLCASFT